MSWCLRWLRSPTETQRFRSSNETNLERLEYADLQNLTGGTWQWIK